MQLTQAIGNFIIDPSTPLISTTKRSVNSALGRPPLIKVDMNSICFNSGRV